MLEVYTDGSTLNNGSPNATGGYGVFFGDKNIPPINVRLNAVEPIGRITNNIAELMAIIAACKYLLHNNLKAVIYTDSMLSIDIITKKKQAHKNLELVREAQTLIHELTDGKYNCLIYTPAHTKGQRRQDIGNEIADLLSRS